MRNKKEKLLHIRGEFAQALAEEEAGREGLVCLMNPDNIILGTVETFRNISGVRYGADELREAIRKVDADLAALAEPGNLKR